MNFSNSCKTKVSPSRLSCRKLRQTDDFSVLDFTQEDGSDKPGLQEFIEKEAVKYQEQKLGITYVFFCDGSPVAFATLSMGDIPIEKMKPDERVASTQIPSYPCLFVGRLGVHKPLRHRDVGTYICGWIIGMARLYSQHIGCRYVALHAVKDSVNFYKKCEFSYNPKNIEKQKLWMYRKIVWPDSTSRTIGGACGDTKALYALISIQARRCDEKTTIKRLIRNYV